jgi:hypothetical protein
VGHDLVPIVFFAMVAFVGVSFSPLGRAFARRFSGEAGALEGARRDAAELEALQGEVADLRRELDEVQNRLDFTERMLAQAKERGQLGAPKEARHE